MRVLVMMSGGVDSSVAAALLVDEGHEVVGATLKLWGGESDSGCCSISDVDDARRHIGHVRTSLEYRPFIDILDDLPHEMELVQRACAAASDAIRMRYFPSELVTSWMGEAL